MKILQVCQSFYPCFASGGVVKSTYELSKRLVMKGHDVTVYTTDGCIKRMDGNNHEPVIVDGIKVFYLKNFSNTLKHRFRLSNPYYLPILSRKELSNFDIIHVHEYLTLLTIPIHYYAKKYGIPYVLQARGSVMPNYQKTLKIVFDHLFGYKFLRDAEMGIALTLHESLQYQKMGLSSDKIRIIPNGIDPCVCNNIVKGKFRREYDINENEQIVLFLGRIHRIKGIDLLVEAFANITKELKDVKLVITGPDDGFLEVLKSLVKKFRIEDKVLFTGPLYENKKFEAYSDANVYVLPSRYEIFGNTVLEAAACGTPVIVTDRCGISDFVDKFGYSVPFDRYSLEKIINNFLNNKLSFKSEKEILKYLKYKFSIDNVVNNIENVYDEILCSYSEK